MGQQKRKRARGAKGKTASQKRSAAPPRFERALELFRAGQLRDAERLCDRLVAKKPRDADARQLAALIARRAQRYEDASAHLEVARQVQPDNAAIANTLGLVCKDQGNLRHAVAAFELAMKLDPESSQCAFNLGIVLEDSGDAEGAAAAYRQACERDPRNELAQYNLARACETNGDPAAAEAAYRAALEIRPAYPKALNNLANLLRRRQGAAREEALYLYEEATELAPDFAGAWCNRGLLLSDLGRDDEARSCFERARELDPNDATAAHMLAAVSGESAAAAPHAYVSALFDDYATTFDDHLTSTLDYAVPKLLGALLAEHCPEPRERGLDLGCGTGLFAEHMRPRCKHLVGVDLSPKMVEVARSKDTYDELSVGDIESFLGEGEERFDVVAAADVFTYCGDLAPIIAAVVARLSPGAVFLFSTEALLGEGQLELRSTGRYAHGRDHLLALAAGHGLETLATERGPIRSNHGEPIIGDLYVLQAPR